MRFAPSAPSVPHSLTHMCVRVGEDDVKDSCLHKHTSRVRTNCATLVPGNTNGEYRTVRRVASA